MKRTRRGKQLRKAFRKARIRLKQSRGYVGRPAATFEGIMIMLRYAEARRKLALYRFGLAWRRERDRVSGEAP